MKIIIISILLIMVQNVSAGERNKYLIDALAKDSKQGLYQQPGGGPFAVFLFRDDALGSNIGIINTAGAAGPGTIELPHPKTWDKWYTFDRLWQEREWAADVTSFAWSPSKRYLYIATSEIYGNGGLFELDLVNRQYHCIYPQVDQLERPCYSTKIDTIDVKKAIITVMLYFDDGNEQRIIEKKEIQMKF